MRFFAIILLALSAPAAFGQEAPAETSGAPAVETVEPAETQVEIESAPAGEASPPVVVVCKITGMIDEGVKVVVQRAVKEAKELDAAVIFFRVDTPGGRVDSAVEIARAMDSAHCKTVSFIEGMGAISAGALISYACDEIVMTPGSNMGAAAPVMMTAEGTEPLGEKETSFVRAKMRALAESNGHNPDIAQAMVDKDIELVGYVDEEGNYIVYATNPGVRALGEDGPDRAGESPEADDGEEADGEEDEDAGADAAAKGSDVVLAKGKLLTLTPKEAVKYGVATAIVEDFEAAVLRELNTKTYVEHVIEANWAETTFRFLTNPTIAGLLLMLAIGGLYMEVRTPGFGIPGIIGVTCLVILFGSHYVLGLAEVLDLLLILAGVILIAFEIFVIPGFGLVGISGFICLVAGLYLTMTNFTIPEYSWQFDRLAEVAYTLIVAAVSTTVLVAATWKILPKTRFHSVFVLAANQDTALGYTAQTEAAATAAIGLEGLTTSVLRPAGKGRFEGKLYDIVSRGDFLDAGVAVRIAEAQGNRYVVKPIKQDPESV